MQSRAGVVGRCRSATAKMHSSRMLSPPAILARHPSQNPAAKPLLTNSCPCSPTSASFRFRSRISRSALLPNQSPIPSDPPTPLQSPYHQPSPTHHEPASSSSATSSRLSTQERWKAASAHLMGDDSAKLLTVALATAGLGGTFGLGIDLDGPGFTISALAILALIVVVHECGHFMAARLQGIHVSKFAIGFGPPLFTYKGKEVEYSLRLIPLGGYVAFPDDDPINAEGAEGAEGTEGAEGVKRFDPDDPNLLKNRSIPERAAVISAGVIANCIFAYVSILVQVGTVGTAFSEYMPGVLIPSVSVNSAAQRAGLLDGDLVLTVDGWKVPAAAGQVQDVVDRIRLSQGREMRFQVQRDGTVIDVPCLPDVDPDGAGRIGVSIFSNTTISHTKAKDIPDAFNLTNKEFSRLSGIVANGLLQIVTNFSKMAGQLSGPVAIVAAGSEIARIDSAGLFQFCAIININLAAVNVLPLPALDGGYLLLLLVEAARGGRKLPQELEQGFQASGMLLLTAMGMGLVIRDTINLVLH